MITAAPYPMDIDLYQSQKALGNSKLALEEMICKLGKYLLGLTIK